MRSPGSAEDVLPDGVVAELDQHVGGELADFTALGRDRRNEDARLRRAHRVKKRRRVAIRNRTVRSRWATPWLAIVGAYCGRPVVERTKLPSECAGFCRGGFGLIASDFVVISLGLTFSHHKSFETLGARSGSSETARTSLARTYMSSPRRAKTSKNVACKVAVNSGPGTLD